MVVRAAATLLSVLIAVGLVLGGCSDGDGDRRRDGTASTPAVLPGSGPPPPVVPDAAEQVTEPLDAGAADATPRVPEEEQHIFFTMSCADDVLTLVTTLETLYAELPCDRAVTPDVVARFLGVPVRMRVEPSVPAKLFIESETAGSIEFTVGRVWIEER